MQMATGDSVSVLDEKESIVVYLNTGNVDENGKAVIDRATINGISPSAQEQAKYDFAYNLAGLTSKTVDGINLRNYVELGPIG